MKRTIGLAAVTLLSSCAFHQQPYVAHDGKVPNSGTAVFSVIADDPSRPGALEILEVDGRPTSCVQVGCPVWVRVAPGSHKFRLRFNTNHRLEGGFIKWRTASPTVEVTDMKALHVYHALPLLSSDSVSVEVRDLGERPKHGITLGLEGANRKYYPVEF